MMYIRWGLMTICEAVEFFNEHSLRHNNIFHGAIFVDDSGSWKLGELGYVSNENASFPSKVVDTLIKYNIPNQSATWFADFWGLGVLVWEIFNGELVNSSSLHKSHKVPSELFSVIEDLSKKNISKQDATSALSKLKSSCSRNNLLVSVLDVLQNYHLKDKDVKCKACKDLANILSVIPKDMLLKKIMKLLIQVYEFDSDKAAFLVPLVAEISSLITEEEFQENVEHFIVTLFSSNDRAIRLALLMRISEIISKMTDKTINSVFPYVSTGFLDSNHRIRGETVKALIHFIPKLSKKHLNEEALRHLLQIQSKDPEAYIRTNTTICLGKIAMFLQPDSRKKYLLTAFLHALRDPFPAVRNAGTQAFAVTHKFFTLDVIAKNILPGLVSLTVDPELSVRQNAFQTIKMLLSKLEKFSNSPELKEDLEKDVMNQACESYSSWSSWVFSSITSKFMKPDEPKTKSISSEHHENKVVSDEGVLKNKPFQTSSSERVQVQNVDSDKQDQLKRLQNVDGDDSDDKSDWEDDGWGEANEEVLTSSEVANSSENISSKKNQSGPMKLGTRLGKL